MSVTRPSRFELIYEEGIYRNSTGRHVIIEAWTYYVEPTGVPRITFRGEQGEILETVFDIPARIRIASAQTMAVPLNTRIIPDGRPNRIPITQEELDAHNVEIDHDIAQRFSRAGTEL